MTRRHSRRSGLPGRFMPFAACAAIALGGGCSSGSGEDAGTSSNPDGGWTPGVFLPASGFAARCVNPRVGLDPASGQPWPDVQGSLLDENNFLRSWSDETYLWYDEIVDRDPAGFDDPLDYFDLLKTTATTANGTPRDRFHFTHPTDEWRQLSQSGVAAGYGAAWVILRSSPPRDIVVAYTEPGSPATDPGAGLIRGTRILAADGAAVSDGPAAVLNAALFPEPGETHSFTVQDPDGTTRDISMTAETLETAPVQNVHAIATPAGHVGYLLFNDHIATAEAALVAAIETLAAESIDELVLDVRYNGGGFLAIASQLAYMIAGSQQTGGRNFERMEFNDKHPATNPVTGEPLQPMPFIDATIGFSVQPAGQPLPALDLGRVHVLTGSNTCSASESIINSLRGVGVEVLQVGGRTCGKPYGFYPTDNCGTTYFTIQFRGVNDAGYGDYTAGFLPVAGPGNGSDELPGCAVPDDFTHALGDPLEGRFAAALSLIVEGACPSAPAEAGTAAKAAAAFSPVDGDMPKPPWRTNRLLEQNR